MTQVFKILLVTLVFSLFSNVMAQKISIGKTEGFKVEKMEGKEITISFKTAISNATSKGVGVTIKKGKLFKDGDYYGSFQLLDKIKLKSNSNDNQSIRIKVNLEKELDVMNDLQSILKKPIELKLTGKVKATWFIFWKKYPFEVNEKVSLKGLLGR